MSRYFKRSNGREFEDDTDFVEVAANGRVWIHKRSGQKVSFPSMTLEACLDNVDDGMWAEVYHHADKEVALVKIQSNYGDTW